MGALVVEAFKLLRSGSDWEALGARTYVGRGAMRRGLYFRNHSFGFVIRTLQPLTTTTRVKNVRAGTHRLQKTRHLSRGLARQAGQNGQSDFPVHRFEG